MGPGDHVGIRTDKEKLWDDSGIVTSANHETRSYMVETDQSYMVETDHGLLRRNRRHLQHTEYPNVNEPQSRGEPSTPVESSEVEPALTRRVTISGENSYAIRACCASSQAIRGLCYVKVDYL